MSKAITVSPSFFEIEVDTFLLANHFSFAVLILYYSATIYCYQVRFWKHLNFAAVPAGS
jgi:hypothetical protein